MINTISYQQPESSGGEEEQEGSSYRPVEKTIDPLDLTVSEGGTVA